MTSFYPFNRKWLREVKDFFYILRRSFNMATYDELRSSLCFIQNDSFNIPNEAAVESVYDSIVRFGLEGMVSAHNKKVMTLVPKLKSNLLLFGIKEMNQLSYVPTFSGIFNNINARFELCKQFDMNLIALKDITRNLVTLDIDSIAKGSRTKVLELLAVGKI